jgi:hypothetical protein
MSTTFKKIVTDVVTTAGAVGVVLALVLNLAPVIHLPAQYVAIIVTVSSVVAAVGAQARRVVGAKAAAKR